MGMCGYNLMARFLRLTVLGLSDSEVGIVMPLDSVGARLAALRKTKGWSVHDVAKFTGIPATTLSDYETDQSPVPADRLEILARLYLVSTDWIVTGKDTAENTRRRWPEGYAVLTRLNKELTEEEKDRFLDLADRVAENPGALKYLTREEWDRILRQQSPAPDK